MAVGTSILRDLKDPTLMSFLDMARWGAAALVFIGHLRNPLFVSYGDVAVSDRNLWVNVWYFVSGLHAEAVIVFFVLSGFLVGGAGFARLAGGKFEPGSYAVDRVSRLYVAFLPALFLGLLLDTLGSQFFSDVGFWNHLHPMIAQKINTPAFEQMISWETLLGNSLMLQNFFVPSLGSNQPLWTISMEFWFYVIFGLTSLVWMSGRKTHQGLIILSMIAVFAVLGWSFVIYLGMWLIGIGAALVSSRRAPPFLVALLVFAAALIAIRLNQSIFDTDVVLRTIKNYAVAASFGFLIISVRGRRFSVLIWLQPLNKFFADFSYSLYLVHFPVMIFLLAVFHSTEWFPGIAEGYSPTSAAGLLLYGSILVITYALSWAFSRMTEARTHIVRGWLKRYV